MCAECYYKEYCLDQGYCYIHEEEMEVKKDAMPSM
jgi:hypothetical protein